MTRYPHAAFPNLYLLNGYKEVQTTYGIEREYEQEDDLERCIGRLVLRKPQRLRGWDLRFLRRMMGLSQGEFAKYVDRDAQTVARWEKTADVIPSFVDLTVRSRFAAQVEPHLSISHVLSYVDGTAPRLPETIYLGVTAAGWQFELEPVVKFAHSTAQGSSTVRLAPRHGFGYRLFESAERKNTSTLVVEQKSDGAIYVKSGQWEPSETLAIFSQPQHKGLFTIDTKGTSDADASSTIH